MNNFWQRPKDLFKFTQPPAKAGGNRPTLAGQAILIRANLLATIFSQWFGYRK
jgi:hypothetical protein